MNKSKLIYAIADLVREIRLSVEKKNARIGALEKSKSSVIPIKREKP